MEGKNKQLFGLAAEQLKNLRVITARATVRPVSETDDIRAALSGVLPKVTEGEPTKLLVTAWMCHEGVNNNRLAFRKEDLAPSAAKIKAPNLLPMDWNHAAVFGSWDPVNEPAALGVWYEAEEKFDQAALEGKGAWGIEAKGVVWAWAFPEKATEMLATQAIHGYIEFSMACIPESYVLRTSEDGKWYDEAVNPVFMTLSALSVPPGDPDAKGTVTNLEALTEKNNTFSDSTSTLEFTQEQKQLIAAALKTALQLPQRPKEDIMDPETLNALQVALKAAQDAAEAEKALRETAEAAAKAAQEQMEAATLKAEGLSIEVTKLTETAATLAADLEAAQKKVQEFEAVEQARVTAARWEKRMSELPESYRAALHEKTAEEQEQFEARWAAATDEVWSAFISDLKVAFNLTRVSYFDRSKGLIPAASHSDLRSELAALIK